MSDATLISLVVCSAAYVAMLLYATRNDAKAAGGDLTEFFVSGRDLGIWTTIATLGATEIGVITVAYNAQTGFNQGFSSFHIGVAAFIGALFVGLTGFVVRPLRREGVLTVPEYYGKRYGSDVRVFGATVMALGGVLNMGLFLKVASIFIVTLLGLESGTATMTSLMIGLIVIAAGYTCYGGMRSVITTDVFQFVLIIAGLVSATLAMLAIVPVETAVATVAEKKGVAGFNPFANEHFGMTYVLWMVFVAGIVSSAIWPTALSRALCVKEERHVNTAFLISSVMFMGRMILPAFLGILAFAYFNSSGDAGAALQRFGDDADLLATPAMLNQALPGWMIGFLVVCMFATFMSTQDSYLFCWSSIIARDIAGPLTGRTEDGAFQVWMTRVFIVLIAAYEVYWGLFYEGKEDVWDYLAVSGSIYFCSGVVLLAGGLYWPRATRRGALAALVLGFTAVAGLGPIKTALGLDAWSGPMIGFTSIALSLAGFIIGSLSEAPRAKPIAEAQA
ncbi:MAG: sodium:solute symporter family protein [Hyphomicrobium sp.]